MTKGMRKWERSSFCIHPFPGLFFEERLDDGEHGVNVPRLVDKMDASEAGRETVLRRTPRAHVQFTQRFMHANVALLLIDFIFQTTISTFLKKKKLKRQATMLATLKVCAVISSDSNGESCIANKPLPLSK